MTDRRRAEVSAPSSAAKRALDELVVQSYPALRALAVRALRDERAATLRPTALIHEIYLRLVQLTRCEWQGRPHLLAMATRVARQALVDEARRRNRSKRAAGTPVTVTLERLEAPAADRDILEVDDLLRELEAIDETAAQVVELRVFGGLSVSECAEELGTSASTVNRKWRAGRTWLVHELAA
jgi:RNA polymerase sigma-70 factor, ECF subfamily